MSSFIRKIRLSRRQTGIIFAVVALAATATIIYVIRINDRIHEERERQASAGRPEVKVTRLRAPSADGLTVYLNAADVRATTVFEGQRYLASSGGLIAVDAGGSVKRRYTTLDGLPENDLTALEVFRDRLFIGTANAGLLTFDGNEFTRFDFVKPRAVHVSALAATGAELLVGTLDGGLFEFDGEGFSRRYSATGEADFDRVTALCPLNSRVYIGTQNQGLYVWREGRIEHVGTGEGLPSPHVTGIVELPPALESAGTVAVATDFGIVGLSETNQIKALSTQPNVTSLATSGGRLWAGLFTGGVIEVGRDLPGREGGSQQIGTEATLTAGIPKKAAVRVLAEGGELWALTSDGAFVRDQRANSLSFRPTAASLTADQGVTADHVTGITIDDAGRIWIGYFDRGIDVVDPETWARLFHLEDENLRQVNSVGFKDSIYVGTSRGLVSIAGSRVQHVYTREKDGLVNNSVAHVTFREDSPFTTAKNGRALMLATAGGLTEIAGGRARSLTAFHGLSSNHLYTTAAIGSRLFAGSLAGLVELEGLRVVRVYKTSNSPLSHDWVSALAAADGTLFVGTNGGGVDALLPSGEWVNFSDQIEKFEVNQNAMHYDGERVYVGSTDRGMLAYDTRARRWSQIKDGLTSPNVTAIASDDRFLYIGTLNGLTRVEKRILQ